MPLQPKKSKQKHVRKAYRGTRLTQESKTPGLKKSKADKLAKRGAKLTAKAKKGGVSYGTSRDIRRNKFKKQ